MWGTSWSVFYLDSQRCLCCVYSTRKNVEKNIAPIVGWLRLASVFGIVEI